MSRSADQESMDETPKERLDRLQQLDPVRRRLPRNFLVISLILVLILGIVVLIASFISNQSEELFKMWTERILNGRS